MEKKIRRLLLEIDRGYEKTHGRGFFYIQMPSSLSRFYMREQLAFIRRNWDKEKNIKMLDYGCGVGAFMLYMWHHGYTDIEGRDIILREVETARKIFKEFNCPFTVTHVEMNDIYNIIGSFNVIFFNDFLYTKHFDLPRVLKSARKALGRNGLVCFDLFEHQGNNINQYRYYFSEKQIREISVEAGYTVAAVSVQDTGERKTLYILRKEG